MSNPILKTHTQKSTIYLTGAFCMLFIIAALLIPDLLKTKMGEWTASSIGVFGGFYLWFGLAAVILLGLGSRQLLDAMVYWTGIQSPDSRKAIYLLLSVCILATLSAFLGVSKGIRILSNLNIGMATSLLIFAWIIGNEWSVAASLFRTMGAYILEFIPMGLNLGSQKVSESFLTDWIYFYWAFWLAWAPFTGVFIARISKGRTIRQFIVGVLLVPALGTFIWFTVFGSNAFLLIETGQVGVGQFESIYSGIFNFLGAFPFSRWSNAIATLLVFTFLITSVDSAIFVLSMFSDEGKTEPNKVFRLFWGVSITLFTTGLILVGKDQLLESVSQMLILAALPFSLMFCGMVIYFIYGLYPSKK